MKHLSLVIPLLLVIQTAGTRVATAGELDCMFGVRLDGLMQNIKWKSSSCFKPSPPLTFVSSAAEYNMAIDNFNYWLSQMKMYLECLNNEAAGDIKKLSDIVVEGAKRSQQETADEISSARSRLLMSRPVR